MTAATTIVTIPEDLDDTARLILMDQPDMNVIDLKRALYRQGCRPTLEQVQALGRKYIGRGFEFATHSVNTGKAYRS